MLHRPVKPWAPLCGVRSSGQRPRKPLEAQSGPSGVALAVLAGFSGSLRCGKRARSCLLRAKEKAALKKIV